MGLGGEACSNRLRILSTCCLEAATASSASPVARSTVCSSWCNTSARISTISRSPARALEQHRLEALEGLGKLGKRSAVPQRARLALEDTQVVAPVVEGSPWPVVAPAREHPQMLGDDLAFGANHDAAYTRALTGRLANKAGTLL